MSYLPFRDNPELTRISDLRRLQIGILVEQLEEKARQSEHDNDSCMCEPGRAYFPRCVNGARWVSVDAEEIVALMFVAGMLDPEALDKIGDIDEG